MEEQGKNDDILILDNALIFDTESGGESAIKFEADVLLLTNALAPEPVIKKIDVGPRISTLKLQEAWAERNDTGAGWNIVHPPTQEAGPVRGPSHQPTPQPLMSQKSWDLRASDQTAQPISGHASTANLAHLLAEARTLATDYCVLNARSRKALYAALGKTYDLTFYADNQPEAYSRLVEEAGLAVQDRAPYTPIIKLVFGVDYDKTRVAEFAAAIIYGRRKNLSAGSFSDFLNDFEGGLKAVVSLERLIRQGDDRTHADSARNVANPAIARKLRAISPQNWDGISSKGDEFALLMARRLPDGTISIVGEIPRDIAILEKAARKLLANLAHSEKDQTT